MLSLGTPTFSGTISLPLEREMPVPVWGWAEPGSQIAVSFAGQTKTATAGKDGKWTVTLDPLQASFEAREMLFQASRADVRRVAGSEPPAVRKKAERLARGKTAEED